MLSHKLPVIVLAMTALSLTSTASMHAHADAHRTEYLTFSRSFGLPGVTLQSGTYVFELADPDGAYDLVRVLSRDRKTVYLTAFTYLVGRPADVPRAQIVSFNEASPDGAMPISVWWYDESVGRQFVYPRSASLQGR